jgi:transcriptional regulator with XRE-family HTH domain
MMERARSRDAYWTECAILEFTEELCRCMDAQGITRAELARRLDRSPAFITKILRGNANFTLKTMTRIAAALGTEFKCHLQPDGASGSWFDMFSTDVDTVDADAPAPEREYGHAADACITTEPADESIAPAA